MTAHGHWTPRRTYPRCSECAGQQGHMSLTALSVYRKLATEDISVEGYESRKGFSVCVGCQ